MAIQADHFDGRREAARGPSAPPRRSAIERAARHSRLVRILRIALPVCALFIAALYFLSSGHEVSIGDINASVSRVEINKDRLRMVDPKLEGVTDDNGNYKVTAEFAEQEIGNTQLVHLHKVRAELSNGARGWTRLTSPKGLFDTKTQALVLTGDIKVTTHSGLTSYLTQANVDMKSQIVTSTEPVKVLFPDGELDARAMHIAMKAREISFLGDVKLRITPKPQDKVAAGSERAGGTFAKAFKSREPVEVQAPRLTIYDNHRIAHFTGGVLTTQAGSRMTSNELKAYYTKSPAEGAAGGAQAQPATAQAAAAPTSGKLNRIEAIGEVRIATAEGRTATGALLVYDAPSHKLVIDQEVTVGQGDSVLRGWRMVVDLATSVTSFPPGKRVHGHFVPKASANQKQAASAPQRPGGVDLGAGGSLDLSSARGKPLDIEADTLTVHDAKKEAVFDGNVLTRQGGMDMRSASLRVFYGGEAKPGERDGAGSISKARAEGSVLITTDKDQAVTSEWALYDAASRIVTIGGNVVLTQKENVIKGERLVIDLNTGRSRFEDRGNVATNGRVRMLFTPKKDPKRENATAPAGR